MLFIALPLVFYERHKSAINRKEGSVEIYCG